MEIFHYLTKSQGIDKRTFVLRLADMSNPPQPTFVT